MSDVKSVQLSMSDADLKAFSRGTTRKRRTKRSETNVSEDPMAVSYGGAATIQVEKGGVDLASLPSPVAPPAVTIPVNAAPVSAPVPVVSTTAVVGGACQPIPVTIQAKKNAAATPAPIPAVTGGAKAAAKIVPTKKRISAAPAAQTHKKPRLVVPLAAALANPATTSPKNVTESAKVGVSANPVPVQPKSAPKKRRFTERKISIEVKSAKATRKHRRNLKHKIETMPIANVKKLLFRKGVLKPKEDGKMPPDDMMRSMLKDYLLLHTAE